MIHKPKSSTNSETDRSIQLASRFLVLAEKELAAFVSAVHKLFGAEQARKSALHWIEELERMDWPSGESIPDWRQATVVASARLALWGPAISTGAPEAGDSCEHTTRNDGEGHDGAFGTKKGTFVSGSNSFTQPGGSMTGKPFTLLVDIPLKPGRAEEFMALLNDVFEAMKVEETFVSATALRRAEDPDTVLLYENWIDRDNFLSVQLKRPYRDRYEARLPELLRSPRNLSFLDPIRSVP